MVDVEGENQSAPEATSRDFGLTTDEESAEDTPRDDQLQVLSNRAMDLIELDFESSSTRCCHCTEPLCLDRRRLLTLLHVRQTSESQFLEDLLPPSISGF